MKSPKPGIFGVVFGAMLAMASLPAVSQTCPVGGAGISCEPQGDIDLFTSNNASTADNPNILFVLDNTSNWAGNDQHFPGDKQGEAEVLAIKNALTALGTKRANLNAGIMAFPAAEQGSSPHGGYVRHAIKPMDATNFPVFTNLLEYMGANITDSQHERQNSNLPYGNLMADAYNYFKGLAPIAVSADVTSTGNADSAGYDTNYTDFKSPITGSGCGRNYIIFIANPNSNGPRPDSASNTAYLTSVGGSATQPPIDLFSTGNVASDLGFSTNCYATGASGVSSCSTTEASGTFASQCADFASCSCDSTNTTPNLSACASGQRYTVIGSGSGSPTTTTTTTTTTATGTSGCYATSGACGAAADQGGLTCPANTDTGVGSNPRMVETHSYTYACGTTGGGSCPAGPGTPSTSTSTATSTSSAPSAACYVGAAACTSAGDKGGLTCPSNTGFSPATCSSYPCTQTSVSHSCSYACGTIGASCSSAGSGSVTLTACSATKTNKPAQDINPNTDANTPPCPANTATRTYSCPGTLSVTTGSQSNNNVTCTGNGGNATWPINRVVSYTDSATNRFAVTQTDTATTTTKTTPPVPQFTYGVTQTITKTTTTTTSNASTTNLGNSFGCYATIAACNSAVTGASEYGSVAGNYSGGLSCSNPTTTTGSCPSPRIRYQVQGVNTGVAATGVQGSFANKDLPLNANLWARHMHQTGVADTYTIDVYKAKPSNISSQLYYSMAKQGGGKYYSAQNQSMIESALTDILDQILSVNTNFASAALPISATNRAQNVNQVFIGMFRPNADGLPRWWGNLKRYQLIKKNGDILLGDAAGNDAVNIQTGFVANCAASYWTTDSGTYWENVTNDKPVPKGVCPTTTNSPWSDSPDGPFVEKGATAEVVRMGNASLAGNVGTGVNRKFLTLDTATMTLVPMTAANSGLSTAGYNFITGHDVDDEDGDLNVTEPRPSVHGDVIHSRPLPVNYGTAAAPSLPIAVYYGSNDGTYRGVDATTGQELWAFVAPETTSRLNRLVNNAPKVLLYGGSTSSSPTSKDWFFDGSTGIYQPADNSNIWIFPTMHRGGRMLYALDVTSHTAPVFKWRAGCPDLGSDTGCTVDSNGVSMSEIGQTWSFPNVAKVKGYTDVAGTTRLPLIVMGGGYDKCYDANTSTPSCGSAKGRVVYILDANDGRVLKKFATSGSVTGDVSLVDVNNDNFVDFGYAVDLNGNIYRINFVDPTTLAPITVPANWTMTQIAFTSGGGRRFMYGPAVLPAPGGAVYLALGSGDREHPLINEYPYPNAISPGSGVTNKFYVYLDILSSVTPTDLDNGPGQVDATTADCNATKVLPPPDSDSKSGWFMTLGAGEQVVTSSVIVGGLAAFSTNTPTDPTLGACSSLGDARGYLVNLFSGSGAIGVAGACGGSKSSPFVGGGLPASPVVATVQIGNETHTVLLGGAQKDGGSSSTLQAQDMPPPINPIRKGVYWKSSGDN